VAPEGVALHLHLLIVQIGTEILMLYIQIGWLGEEICMRFSDLNFFFLSTGLFLIVVIVHCMADRAKWYHFFSLI
jgi:hypothetical protein